MDTSQAGSRPIIFFDWDGTLVNSLETKVRNAGRLFATELGVPSGQVEAAYRKHSGIPRRRLFDAICAEAGLPALSERQYARLSARFSALNREALSDPLTPGLVPADTVAALQALRGSGCRLYVSSSAETEEIRAIAAALGLAGYFDGLFGSQPGFTKGKDHIDWALQELQGQGAGLVRVIFVGDEPADLLVGEEAGVRTIAKVGTCSEAALRQRGARETVYLLTELLSLIP